MLNEGPHPFLLRRTSYRKMFKGQYAPDPFEPGAAPTRTEEWAESFGRKARMKLMEWFS
ncbi:MAG: hypothetical protein AB7H71_13305 [Alphaproteobacteria bacterium]